ncbi:hypothetical protein PoB_002265900 [Plakobranchus ocellatus]|uniref:Uncharacterized protein n=1 Tax=Plakobranchus ocellatus TaxID=259542 RepID=A0AAV3ZP52_9GAST|nr:hypothetical protein PoB_002265900 [Plakobranchus ocellatus]
MDTMKDWRLETCRMHNASISNFQSPLLMSISQSAASPESKSTKMDIFELNPHSSPSLNVILLARFWKSFELPHQSSFALAFNKQFFNSIVTTGATTSQLCSTFQQTILQLHCLHRCHYLPALLYLSTNNSSTPLSSPPVPLSPSFALPFNKQFFNSIVSTGAAISQLCSTFQQTILQLHCHHRCHYLPALLYLSTNNSSTPLSPPVPLSPSFALPFNRQKISFKFCILGALKEMLFEVIQKFSPARS